MAKKNSKKTVPDLRFRGFTDPWEQRQLGEVAQRVTRRNLNNECSRVLTASAEAGLIDQQEYFQKRIASHDLSHYYLLKRGDFAYNHSSSGSAALGIIKRLEAYDFGCLSTLYIIFHPKHGIDSDYLLHYFESSAWHGDVAGMVTEGARNHGLLNISPDTFFTARCSFPSLPEQRRIGKFFTIFDSLIAAAERQEALLRQKKQAYLQLMFPREGETEPRLRFAGYNGEWERRQLGEVAEVHNGRDYKHLRPGSIPVYGTSGYMLSVDDALSWNDDAVGIGRKGTIDRPYILRAPFWTVDTLFFVTPRPSTPLEFLFTVFESVNWESKDESTGVPSLTKQAIVNTAVKVPNTSEQRRIGEFFTQIDHMIEIISKQAAALQTMKRAYLQKMFI